MFHHFTDARHPAGQGAITADQLRALLDWVGLDRLLPARVWLDRFRSGDLDGELCLTFDDNLRCQYDVALPVLRELNLTAFWFVYSSPIEGMVERLEVYRYFRTVAYGTVDEFYLAFDVAIARSQWADEVTSALTSFDPSTYLEQFSFYTDGDRRFRFLRDQVLGQERFFVLMDFMVDKWGPHDDLPDLLWMNADHWIELHADGHVIGMHSHTHPTDLATMSIESQRQEYVQNQSTIETVVGERPTVVAHPASSYSGATLDMLRELDVEVGFATHGPVRYDERLEILRHDHSDLVRQTNLWA